MPNAPPTVTPPPRVPMADADGAVPPVWQTWFEKIFLRVGGGVGAPIIGDIAVFQTTVGQAALASAGTVILLDAAKGEQWRVRELVLSGAGTNFSGGDRLLSVSDGASTWTVVPAATLQALAAARWGDTGVPFPATAAHLTASSTAGVDIVAQYSGGATDHSAGSLTLVVMAERMV